MMKTKPYSDVENFKNFVRQPYAWPGGYPLFAITADGACLCKKCAKENAKLIIRATVENDGYGGWQVIGVDVNWENDELICDNCYEKI